MAEETVVETVPEVVVEAPVVPEVAPAVVEAPVAPVEVEDEILAKNRTRF